MKFEARGVLVANISKTLGIPVSAVYEWPEDNKVATITGIVTGPVRPFAGSPKRITRETRLVDLKNIERVVTVNGKVTEETRGEPWVVHTNLIRIRI